VRAPEGQSQQLMQIFQLPCGFTIAKSLSALARQSNQSGALPSPAGDDTTRAQANKKPRSKAGWA